MPRGKEKKRSREKEGLGSWGRVGEEGKETEVLFLVQCGGYKHPSGLELTETRQETYTLDLNLGGPIRASISMKKHPAHPPPGGALGPAWLVAAGQPSSGYL